VRLELSNINKSFGTNRAKNQVLQDVNISFPESGLVAIYGKSGSGKTTILNIIGGLLKPDSGSIKINDEAYPVITDDLRNQYISYVFQNYYLENNYTVSDVISHQMIIAGVNSPLIIKESIDKNLKLVGLEKYKNRETYALSGGEKQRVAIARALAKNTPIILADEPTGNLDTTNSHLILSILRDISKEKLVILVTHELDLMNQYADYCIEIIDGQTSAIQKIVREETDKKDETEILPAQEGGAEQIIPVVCDEPLCDDGECLKKKKKYGVLFNIKRTITGIKKENQKEKKSLGVILQKLFIACFAIAFCLFSTKLFTIFMSKNETKHIDESSIYTNLNSYTDIQSLDKSLYSKIDYFEATPRQGYFVLPGVSKIKNVDIKYDFCAIDSTINEQIIQYGELPAEGEILVSSALANEIKRGLREKNGGYSTVLHMKLDNKYQISGIINSDERKVFFNRTEYINFLQIYSEVKIDDINELFFKDHYKNNRYFSLIGRSHDPINNDELILLINRNSAYKMVDDVKFIDYLVDVTNTSLLAQPKTIQLHNSKLFIKKIFLTRENFGADVKILINDDVINDIFMYILPNIETTKQDIQNRDLKLFQIQATDAESLETLKATVREVDINSFYKDQLATIKKVARNNLDIFIIILVLLSCIYYFIEKATSVKKIKEYGVFRAIGVKKSNIFNKIVIETAYKNLIEYFVIFLLTSIVLAIRYHILNISVGYFILLNFATFVGSLLLLILFALIPYLYLVNKMPADILAKYDI